MDASGQKIFELRHMGYALKNDWAVEDPNGVRLCSLKHPSILARNRGDLDATVHQNVGDAGSKDVSVQIRPRDQAALTTIITCGDSKFATVHQLENNDIASIDTKPVDRTVWRAQITAGTDLSFVLIAVLCLAEMAHVWKR
ncbi:hypothetical protein AAFC00_000188 [Neodothiora populina]